MGKWEKLEEQGGEYDAEPVIRRYTNKAGELIVYEKDLALPQKLRHCLHRATYCYQNEQACKNYIECLDHHVMIEKLDDKPFKKYRESSGNCYTRGTRREIEGKISAVDTSNDSFRIVIS